MVLRILDLYAGLGGTARGIQKVLTREKIPFEYYAIENDQFICQAHKKNNPESLVICADVNDLLDQLPKFDFIWASPPCQTHSCVNFSNKVNNYRTNPVDWSLWHVIDILQRTNIVKKANISYVVENVKVWYNEPFEHTFRLDRHYFWSNIKLVPFKYHKKPAKDWSLISQKNWQEYHQVEPAAKGDKRQQLRNCVHWSISEGIFEQFLKPRETELTDFLTLGADTET